MRALDWLRNPQRVPLKPVYVVYGSDHYLRREVTQRIGRLAVPGSEDSEGLATSRFEGQTAQLADVLDELQLVPLFSERRVVVVDDADGFVSRYRGELESSLSASARRSILVLRVGSWPSGTRIARLVESVGLALDCSPPAAKELTAYLIHLAQSQGGAQLEAEAARLIVELVGNETGIAVSELEKLAVYVGEHGTIRQPDVLRLVDAGRIETIWKVLDAATTGQPAEALRLLDSLLNAGEPPIKLLAALSSSLSRIHHAGWLRARRWNLEEACRAAGIRDFAFEKTRRQHAHLGPSRVDQLPELLAKADLDLKGGSPLEPRFVLEELIVRLALPRTD